MITKEQEHIKEDQCCLQELCKINLDLIEEYQRRQDNHRMIIQQIQHTLQNKLSIDSKFMCTDNVIQ